MSDNEAKIDYLQGNKDDAFFEASILELDKIINQSGLLNSKDLNFLLSLWGYFFIHQVEPSLVEKKKDSSSKNRPQIMYVKGGWKVLGYLDGMITSAGDCYGAFATGAMLKTIKFMIENLAKRGAKTVSFTSNLAAAQRFAWLLCKKYGIESYFLPGTHDIKCEERVRKISGNRSPGLNDRRKGG